MRLALFDLDNTLLDGDSDLEWSDLLARHGSMDAVRARAFHVQYDEGSLDIDEFLRFQLEPLARLPIAHLLAWRQEFVRDWIRPRISDAARELVREHARAGHELVMITATNRFITEPIAEEFGIAHLIATEPEKIDGHFTGGVSGVPCFREGKIMQLDRWLVSRGLAFTELCESWFYSDSHNDLPLLSRVTHAIAVNADAKLARHAHAAGWKTLDLKRPQSIAAL